MSFLNVANFFFANIPGFTHELFYKVKDLYDEWNFWIIFTAGFTPIPYKVFTITGGAFNVNIFLIYYCIDYWPSRKIFSCSFLNLEIWRTN